MPTSPVLVAGITHVVEHLAFQRLGHLMYFHNGTVDSVCTRFVVAGAPEDVVAFYRGITENLRDLPVDRLGQELQVLQVEEQRSAGSQVGRDLSQRFGPCATGLIGWPEHGLKVIGSDDVTAWAHSWFTASNAVLWTSGPLPDKLDLSALPAGDTPRTPMAPPLTPPRTFVAEPTTLVSVSAVMERQIGIGPALQILQRRAYDRLRHRDAISYGIAVDRLRLDANHALVYVGADGTEGTYTQVFKGLIEVWTSSSRRARPELSGTTCVVATPARSIIRRTASRASTVTPSVTCSDSPMFRTRSTGPRSKP